MLEHWKEKQKGITKIPKILLVFLLKNAIFKRNTRLYIYVYVYI